MFHMTAVGLSSSILGCLLTLLVYTYCQRYQQQSHDATVIHPVSPAPLNTNITNHIKKLDKYDSMEAIKVRGESACAWRREGFPCSLLRAIYLFEILTSPFSIPFSETQRVYFSIHAPADDLYKTF